MNDLLLVVEPLIPALRRYARALLRDREIADELVQDCLERVISRWGQRRNADDTRQWVFAILHNLAINRLRQRTRRGPHLAMEDIDEADLSTPAPQEHSVTNSELMRALDLLPEDQRAVLLLVSVEDMSYADAAKTLDIPIGTVMSRLSRARQRVHRMLDGVDPMPSTSVPEIGNPTRPALRRLK